MKKTLVTLSMICLSAIIATPVAAAPTLEAAEIRVLRQPRLQSTQPLIHVVFDILPEVAKRHGVDLTVTTMSSQRGADGNDAMLAGRLDIVVSAYSTYASLESGVGNKAVALTGWSQYDYWLICNDENIKSVADFTKATKVAFKSANAAEHIFLRQISQMTHNNPYALDQHVVILPREQILQQFQSGRSAVDCAIAGNPDQNTIVRGGHAHIVYRSNDQELSPVGLLSYSLTEWAEQNPILVRIWREAVGEAVVIYNSNPEKYLAKWAEIDGIDADPVSLQRNDVENRQVFDATLTENLVTYINTLKALGMSKSPARTLDEHQFQ